VSVAHSVCYHAHFLFVTRFLFLTLLHLLSHSNNAPSPPRRMASPSLPLHCNICPKKPDFSDVSHLLTHIASKGHLSHYYKVKVRSSHERVSRDLIEAYDRWYVTWNVEQLMSERMHLKDRRRLRGQGRTQRMYGFSRAMLPY